MTQTRNLAIVIAFVFACALPAQDVPTPTPSAMATKWPSLSPLPEEPVTPSPVPEQSPSVSPVRTVRISFVPPPLEGSISLGIYDKSGKLVRVLHQEGGMNEFAIGDDALVTQWDGKNEDGLDLPPGKYCAHGYLVGQLKIEDLGQSAAPPPEKTTASAKVKLMPNPLANDKQSIVDVGVGFDSDGSYLKMMDDLPLLTVNETPNLVRVWITKNSDKSVTVWQDDGAAVHQFRISGIDKLMAFDCGEFELK